MLLPAGEVGVVEGDPKVDLVIHEKVAMAANARTPITIEAITTGGIDMFKECRMLLKN